MGKSNKENKRKGKEVADEITNAAETLGDAEGGNKDAQNPARHVAGEKQPNNDKSESSGATDVNGQQNVVPSSQEQWETMKAMMAQLDVLTKALVPDPVVPAVRSEIIKVSPIDSPRKRRGYLDALEHMSRLKTKHFPGSSDPIVADEWRSGLVMNFNSTRCPKEYQKDIDVHFLEEEAHDRWVLVVKRKGGQVITYVDFEKEFNMKFFPPEAWDRLESAYLNLIQGDMTVRAYDAEFNRLVGKEIEVEKAQVCHFICGLRVHIHNHCVNGVFNSVVEVVERAAMIEAGLEEEKQLRRERVSSRSTNPVKTIDRKRKLDKVDNARSDAKFKECRNCGKYHSGSCWRVVGHVFVVEARIMRSGTVQGWKMAMGQGPASCAEKRDILRGNVRSLTRADRTISVGTVARNLYRHHQRDRLLHHACMNCPRKILLQITGRLLGKVSSHIGYGLVRAAGGQVMYPYGVVRGISVIVNGVDMPTDLIIVPLMKHDVILGMDWLGKYKAYIDYHRG
ncbi:PREDICTED: uncharacterized protein LOC104783401 [Camelina sativa]|uniref:Uncharacterized protein LOC104783401 n=1 Tax=Camelina sativa TaxID=90675 RepID=A0ABM0YWF4_CAMSA|nr:PREDICTED: uncharacterized protein LOC104783401 [Camelina sativa]